MAEHYFSASPQSKDSRFSFDCVCRGVNIHILSSSSVFSKSHLDAGTALLIEEVNLDGGSRVLDLGCGYGVVGIALARSDPSLKIIASDINERAVDLARENARLNGVRIDARVSDGFRSVPESFDAILLNPPQTAGKALCLDLISASKAHLEKGGAFYLVARPAKGGKTLAAHMESVFGNVRILARGKGFAVYVSLA